MSNVPEPFATPLHIRDHCLCLATQQAARALSRRFDEVFRPLGLTSGQFSLLNSLNRPAPPTIGQVAETLAMDRSTVTANLKPLERSGVVISTVDPDDRRGRRVALTAVGRKLLAKATPIWIETHRMVEAELEAGGGDRVRDDLRRLLGR